MGKSKRVPVIRFKGFTEEWEEKEFSNTFSPLNNNTLSRAELNYENGSTKNIHYGDVLIKFGENLDVSKEELPYITNEKIVGKYNLLQDGDIVFADAAEDETVGKCTELLNVLNERIVSGLHTIACRPLFTFANRYLGYYLNASIFHNQLLPLMQGTKVFSVSKSAIKNTIIYYPKLAEQKQIGEFFQNVDNLINANQRKLDKLKNIKKACLEKMFPRKGSTIPEIRFKGFTEQWEEKKLGEIANITMGQSPSGKNYTDNPKDHILVQGNADMKNAYVVPRVWTTEVTKTAKAGDLIMSVRAPVGEIGKTIYNVVIGRGVAAIQGNEFIYQSLRKMNADGFWKKYSTGSTFESINSDTLINATLSLTSENEQQQIGNFFKNLDNLIAKNEQQLEKLKNIKKACLEKMFVNKEDAI